MLNTVVYDKFVASMALSNLLSALELLKNTDCVYKTSFRISQINVLEENIARMAIGLTSDEETGLGSLMMEYAGAILENCDTGINTDDSLGAVARNAVDRLRMQLSADEYQAQEAKKGKHQGKN